MSFPKLSRAPITEALLDIRVESADEIPLEALAKVQAGQEEVYPTRRNQILIHGKVTPGEQLPAAEAKQMQTGFTFISKDEKQIIQAQLSGFTFNRLAPYDRWETFRDEARRQWNIYRSLVQPKSVTRLALRYINRLELPLPIKDFKDYLRTVPEVSPDLPQGLHQFLVQLYIPYPDLKAMLNLNEIMLPLPAPDAKTISIFLDFDIFRYDDVPNDEEEIWSIFEQLRVRKNEAFKACITDRTMELIK